MARKANRAKPGAGSVYQDKRGYWHALWTPPGGKRRHFSGDSEEAARAAMAKAQALYAQGAPADLQTITVGEYLAGWLASQKPLVRAITWQGLKRTSSGAFVSFSPAVIG